MNLRKDHYHAIQIHSSHEVNKQTRELVASLLDSPQTFCFLFLSKPLFLTSSTECQTRELFDAQASPREFILKSQTTFSNGYLGSCDDEERSEMRYVMRIAEQVNHQIFERTWRFLAKHACFSVISPHRPLAAFVVHELHGCINLQPTSLEAREVETPHAYRHSKLSRLCAAVW